MQTNVAIIGCGIAGMTLAVNLAEKRPDLLINIFCKGQPEQSNTAFAQGGIAAVTDNCADSIQQHLDDTLASGGEYTNLRTARLLVNNIADGINDLRKWGARFDSNPDGSLKLHLEGGHAQARVVHCKDQTGAEVIRTMKMAIAIHQNIKIHEDHLVTELISEENKCCGVRGIRCFDGAEFESFAQATILATGGSGQVYSNTTNPAGATGDGIYLAGKAGVKISNMQFIQFHPTALYQNEASPMPLISEAVRGCGAHIVNSNQERFVFKTDVRGELATRDVVSAAIFAEMKSSGKKHVWLDLRHLDPVAFHHAFPGIAYFLKNSGYNIEQDLIPIVPAAHYQCGGITADLFGRTCLSNLYAIGECANNGLQGKNRLASNSLAEGIVFGKLVADHLAVSIISNNSDREGKVVRYQHPGPNIQVKSPGLFTRELKRAVQAVMTNYAGLDCTAAGLSEALIRLRKIGEHIKMHRVNSTDTFELNSLYHTAITIVSQKVRYFKQKGLQFAGCKTNNNQHD